MLRHGVVASVMLVLAVLIGCEPRSKYPKSGETFKGDIEFTVWNHTKYDFTGLTLDEVDPRYSRRLNDELVTYRQPLTANSQRKWSLKAGKYKVNVKGPGATQYWKALNDYELDLQGPTQLVVYDDPQPPADVAAPPGAKQLMEYSYQEGANKKAAEQKANAQDLCKKNIPPANESPSPSGKVKPDGHWTCVLGGDANGTNYVTVVQLADGKITGTMGPGSANRNTSWQGAMVGSEVHFRYASFEGGGRLKLDPGGKAMSGPGWTYSDKGRCVSWNMTCTK